MATLDVYGVPGPQGSKRHVGRGRMVESSQKVKPWRAAVVEACEADLDGPVRGPVVVTITFYFARPRSHYGTGRNAARLRPTAPPFPTSRRHGDVDKLERATLDALVWAGAIDDDAMVVDLHAQKRYGHPAEEGALIEICPAILPT